MGELAALLSAMLWALSNALIGSQTGRVPPVVISALQLFFATLVLVTTASLLLAAGRIETVTVARGLALAATGLIGPGVGDTLYIAGLRVLGLARAFPISMAAFPLFTFVLAALLVGESITPPIALGAVLTVAGITLVVTRGRPSPTAHHGNRRLGLALVLCAALLWAATSVWVRAAGEGVAPVLVGAIRMPAAALLMAMVAGVAGHRLSPAHYGRRTLATLAVVGAVGSGVGSLLWVVGVQEAGAARTAILASTAPLFALPLAALFLHERITRRVILGTLLSVVGIWLVTL